LILILFYSITLKTLIMAQETEAIPVTVDWLEEWPIEGIEFKDEASKEAYKALVYEYLNIWLALYNNHPTRDGKGPYSLKEFAEKPSGPRKLRPFATLTPAIERRPHTNGSGTPRIHLTPPEPPPPPKDDEL
jgi:hypothetical protein